MSGEVLAFYKGACCHRLFVHGVVICRDVAFHQDFQKMAGLHFIMVSCPSISQGFPRGSCIL